MNTSTNVGPRQAITSLIAVDVLEITPQKYVTLVLVKILVQNQFEKRRASRTVNKVATNM